MSATNRGGERKAYDFYATPPETIRSFLANFDGISSGDRILEPSAGNGQIIKVLRESGYDNRIDAVELRPEERATLEALADNVTMSANDYMSTVTSFSGDADQLADAFATAADNIVKNLAEIIPRFAETLPALAGAIVSQIPGLAAAIVPAVLSAGQSILEQARDAVTAFDFVAAAENVVQKITDFISSDGLGSFLGCLEGWSFKEQANLNSRLKIVVDLVGSKLRSLKGLTPCSSKTGTDEITYAGNNGSLWDTQTWSQINMVNMLLILMGKSTNTQAVFGYGHYNGGSSASNLLKTGTISNKGAFYGTSGNAAMKVFHIENYYGDIWNRIRGCVTNGSKQILVKMTPPYNTTGDGYTNTGITPGGTSGGYISAAKMTENGLIPQTAGGSETTYFCDGLWFNASCYALVGGNCDSGLRVGAFCLFLYSAVSNTSWAIGAALSCQHNHSPPGSYTSGS